MDRPILTGKQCKAARQALGLSQSQLSKQSGKSLSYIKQLETNRFRPGDDFQRDLVAFFEEHDIDVAEFADADAPEASPPGEPSRPPVKRCAFYAAPTLTAAELGELFDTMDGSFERLGSLLSQPIARGFLGPSDASNAATHDVFSELALIGLSYAAIAGRITVKPQLVVDATTQEEVIANFWAEARGDKPAEPEVAEVAT